MKLKEFKKEWIKTLDGKSATEVRESFTKLRIELSLLLGEAIHNETMYGSLKDEGDGMISIDSEDYNTIFQFVTGQVSEYMIQAIARCQEQMENKSINFKN